MLWQAPFSFWPVIVTTTLVLDNMVLLMCYLCYMSYQIIQKIFVASLAHTYTVVNWKDDIPSSTLNWIDIYIYFLVDFFHMKHTLFTWNVWAMSMPMYNANAWCSVFIINANAWCLVFIIHYNVQSLVFSVKVHCSLLSVQCHVMAHCSVFMLRFSV